MQDVSEQLFERIAHRLRAMGNPVRLRILHALEDGELSVSQILASVGGSQANLSKHLGVLRTGKLVSARRDGVSVYYRISDPSVFAICEALCESLHDSANAEVEAIERGRAAVLTSRG